MTPGPSRSGWATLALLVAWLSVAGPAAGQEVRTDPDDIGAFRDTLDLAREQPFVLRPFILPRSERILLNGAVLDSIHYEIDYRFGRLQVDEAVLDTTAQLVAVYRTWGYAFKDVYRRRGVVRSEAETDSAGTLVAVEEPDRSSDGFDPFRGVHLERSGSISRGIMAGNNRDVTVESGLRMQLSGEVAEGIRVEAVLTDENTPILPEGTTQRLSEFDRVFIQIEAPQGTAQLGDFDVQFVNSEFARFARKLQGITLFGDVPDPGTNLFGGGRVAVAGATARGIYRTQELDVSDGVQGPYRLEGNENERFILVVPGSESVYINGQKVTRGAENDYVIDYGLGEITFTSKRLITDDLRITVEFQYTTNEFTRTIVGTEADAHFWQRDDGESRARLGVTFLREADSRQLGGPFDLTEADDSLLAVIGDAQAERSGAEPVAFDPEAPYVQYSRVANLDPSPDAPDSIFVALSTAPGPGETVYRVRFSRRGPGGGSYVRAGQSVNGIVYEYRGPGLGEYDPVILLPKPKEQRLFDLRGAVEPLPGLELFGEWARSVHDRNRLSRRDAFDDQGSAYVSGLRIKSLELVLGGRNLGSVEAEMRRRYIGEHFAAFDRIRPVEFARRWNLGVRGFGTHDGSREGEEVIDEARATYRVSANTHLGAELGRIRLGEVFRGDRRSLQMQMREAGIPRLEYRLEHIQSRDSLEGVSGTWWRQQGRIEQPLFDARLVPRVDIEQERRVQQVLGTDSLAQASLAFTALRPGFSWRTKRLDIGTGLEFRREKEVSGGTLRDAGRAWTLQSEFEAKPFRSLETNGSIGYRVRRVTEHFRVNEQRQGRESVVLQWTGRYTPLKRGVDLDWFYEALTERTPKLQEIYIRTGPELGEYVWEDYNGDGIIQLDEFLRERTVDEGTYVRTFIPSDSLESIISVQARMRLQVDPTRIWGRTPNGFRRWLAKVSSRTTVEILEKSRNPELAEIYLLRPNAFRDPQHTLNGRLRVGQDVYLFRGEPRHGVDLSFNQVRSLSDLATGLERRLVNTWRGEGRYRPLRKWGVRVAAAHERHRSSSEQFASRSYDIRSLRLEPEVSFNPAASVQMSAGVAFSQNRDATARGTAGEATAEVWRVPVHAQVARARKMGLSGHFEGAHVVLSKAAGAAVGQTQFELTDGRGPGTSFLWNLSGWYQISRLLRATLSYTGRAPAEAPVLHTVRLQLSAVF